MPELDTHKPQHSPCQSRGLGRRASTSPLGTDASQGALWLASCGVRRVIAALIAFVWGAPLLLLGILVLVYSATSHTETSVDIGGYRIDADLAGAVVLACAGIAILGSVAVWQRNGLPTLRGSAAAGRLRTGRMFGDTAARYATSDHLLALWLWLPAAIGAAFLILFAARLPALIGRVYWDSDAATATVIAETFGHGTVILERFGWFTGLWFELLTKPLPFHRQVWEIGPYVFALVSVALLAWASWRLAGRWAAAMTATAAVATSPFVSYDLVTVNYHTATWAATVGLAVFCLWSADKGAVRPIAVPLALATILAGTTLASDWLFAFVGLIPYALTGVLLVTLRRCRRVGAAILASTGASVLIAWATSAGMRAAGVHVFPVPTQFADANDLWPNFGRMLRGVVQLANGDYFFDAQLTARSALSFACAALILFALAGLFVFSARRLRQRETTSLPLLAYSTFWASTAALNTASFVFSSEGTHGGYYLVPTLYAISALMPVALSRTQTTRLIVAGGITAVATLSLVNLADTRTALLGPPRAPVASVADQVVAKAREAHALKGYADYWDASSLTWSKHMAVQVAPASQCAITQGKTDLCGYWFNVNTHWYTPQAGNTFVLIDRHSDGLRQNVPASYGAPTATYQLNNTITMSIYPYDVARHFIYVPAT
jgi:hypothetical protein